MIDEKKIIPLKFDLMFKKVFGNRDDKRPIRYLLYCILGITPKEITILNSEIIGDNYYEKKTSVDLIVEIDDGSKIGIEMNTNVNSHLINRNLFYMFKIMSKDMKRGAMYNKLNKHIQINFDCEGKHEKPIMKYRLIEEECHEELTDKIEIIRIDVPYYVKRCYNLDVSKLDYRDKFIGLIGLEDKELAKTIIKGEKNMKEILDKVEDFSEDDEIIGAYDGEWHRQEVARVVMLDKIEKAEEEARKIGIEQGIEQGIEKGIEKSIKQTATNMLKENIDVEIISRVTGLSINEIKKIESK